MDTPGMGRERSTAAARASAAQSACPHVKWDEIGFSRSGDGTESDTIRVLLQCPACGLMRWADEEVPKLSDQRPTIAPHYTDTLVAGIIIPDGDFVLGDDGHFRRVVPDGQGGYRRDDDFFAPLDGVDPSRSTPE